MSKNRKPIKTTFQEIIDYRIEERLTAKLPDVRCLKWGSKYSHEWMMTSLHQTGNFIFKI